MIRCSKLSSTGGKTCKGAPNQHAKPTGLGKQASRSLHSAHAKTRRKEGSACPPWQATLLSTSLIARGIARERWGDAATAALAARGADLRADRTREPPDSKRGENETRAQRDPTAPGGTAPGRRNHPARGGGESLTLASAGAVAAAAAAGRGWSTCIGSAAPAAWAPPGSAAMWRVGLRAETTRKWNLLSLSPLSSLSLLGEEVGRRLG